MINLVLFHQFYAEDIKIKEYDYFSGFFKFKWCLYAYWYGINATTNIETFVTIFKGGGVKEWPAICHNIFCHN